MAITRKFFLPVIMVGLLSLAGITAPRLAAALSPAHYQDPNASDPPIADYDAEVAGMKSEARREKDSHFNGRGSPDKKPITILPEGIEPLPTVGGWWGGLSALPFDQSDVVILGDVLAREAHLSNDRTGIYSEFAVAVGEVLKENTSALVVGGSLPVDRLGGSVRFASGKVQTYTIARQGMPRTGSRYLLFLRRTAESDLLILTGYELSGGRVTPLDGEDTNDPRSNLPFGQYRGADQITFLKELRKAAAHSLKVIGRVP